MSYKTKLVKIAFNNTPKKMILWGANKKLKGIAKLSDFEFDSNERQLYAQMHLEGEHEEQEPLEVWLENLTLSTNEDDRAVITVQNARSSRPWLDVVLTKIVLGREWKIPNKHKELIHELFSSIDSELQEVTTGIDD